MKKFISPILLSLLFLSSIATGAVIPSDSTGSGSGVSIQMPSLSVDKVTINKSEYKSGEEVLGSFTVTNRGDSLFSDISFRVLVGSKYEEINPNFKIAGQLLDASELVSFGDLGVGETKTINFKYKIPQFLSGEKLAIEINIYSTNARVLNKKNSQYISVEKTGNSVLMSNAKLILGNGKEYNLTEGPTIYKDKDPKTAALSVDLKNESKNEVTISPLINVYNQNDKSEKLNIKQASIKLNANESRNVLIDLPTFEYTPAVYFAEVLLNDDLGNQLATRIGVRYIVAGDIATLHSIESDKLQVTSGEEFTINYIVTGRPFDTEIRNQIIEGKIQSDPNRPEVGVGKLSIFILNEFGEVIASHNEPFDLYGEKIQQTTLTANRNAKAMKAIVSVHDQTGVSLLEKEMKLSSDYDKVAREEILKKKIMGVVAVIAIILILIIAFVMFKRKKVGISTLTLIIFASTLAMPLFVNGWVWTGTSLYCPDTVAGSPAADVYTPGNGDVYKEGDSFVLTGTVSFVVCTNSGGSFSLWFSDSSSGESGSRTFATIGISGGHEMGYETSDFKTKTVTVPYGARPGPHKITFYLTDGCYVINGYVPYTVRCAPGRITNFSGVCADPIPGVCGSANNVNKSTAPTTDLCSSGIASAVTYDSVNNDWVWTCQGNTTGADMIASCLAPNPTLTVDGVCGSADGIGTVNAPSSDLCSSGTASSVTTQNGKWSWSCTGTNVTGADNVSSCLASKTNGDNTGGGGTGGGSSCESGKYCDGVCLVDGESCTADFIPNPNIELDNEGAVSLKTLLTSPSIGNSGYSCIIDWSKDVFKSYDNFTRCTFSTPTNSITFSPVDPTAPTSATISDVRVDTLTRMSCVEVDALEVTVPGSTSSEEAICRVNWSAVEVN